MLIRVLRSKLRPYRGLLYLVILLQGIQALALLYLPTLNADIIDGGVLAGDNDYIRSTGLLMLGVTFVQIVFAVAAVYVGSRIAMGLGRDVRSELFHRVTDFSAREVGVFGAPSLITRITNDVQQVQMFVVMTCTLALAAPITVVGGIVMAMHQDIGLSWLLAISLPALAVSVGSVVRRMVPTFRRMQDHIDGANGVLREQITGVRVVRAFAREPDEVGRFRAVNDDLTATSLEAGRLMALMFPTLMLIINASSVGVIWFGANRIDGGDMQVGSLVAFLTYFTLILMNVMMGMFVAMMAPRASVCAERIVEVLDTEPSVTAPASPVGEAAFGGAGSIELRDVGFRYPGADEPVLDGIAFSSLAGRTTAIVGSTGAGKTTLVNLMARLVDVTSGAVLVDGVDIRDMEPDALWRRIGLVPQKPYLFSGTVASNLRYGKPDATDDEIWEALRVAQAADFVAAMPGGIEAPITQGGTNVSGGQRQRLAIARALVKKPEIYLFDDSFSALDTATDARLRAALVPYVRGATVVIVAQRVSTIANADQILVLEDGRTCGLGTHDELLASCPTYAEIVESQVGQREAA